MLDAAWKVGKKDRMRFSQFWMKLTEQLLRYDPSDDLYPGDNKFRRSTQQNKFRRKTSKDFSTEEFPETSVMLMNLRAAQNILQFCSMIEQIQQHFEVIQKKTNPSRCDVCGVSTYWKCNTCNSFTCLYIPQ